MTAGDLSSFLMYSGSFSGQVLNVPYSFSSIFQSLKTCEKIFAVIDYEPKIKINRPDAIIPESTKGNISIENISFAYPQKEDVPVLEDISMEIPGGSSVAFVGHSGSGKTTLIRLIQRFYDV